MDNEMLQRLRRELLRIKEQEKQRSRRASQDMRTVVELDQGSQDPGDAAFFRHIPDIVTGLRTSGERLQDIDDAIARIDHDTYGVCENEQCGKEIPLIRLDAQPLARYCVSCQTSLEATGQPRISRAAYAAVSATR